ncbi:uncharacterized protein LAESUDRAFT_651009 [Laetiporus sulphureus 93-53]|uniref:Nitrogen permease regulator 3 n=1 Tax=Laetiporus sulphureus 93-53 TaxID=1314785 RepID=A0A165ETH3_9APHY|nr:uncharacterized protein LAESUDRAFT_651009 [Laetiporus sulphureus 93-53]KZT07725.1 hypothetical protein LAESUDRAFT_651009 [Laetiporus sulphureus 93-53]
MSETVIAVLLATSSAKGSSLVFCWPPAPESSPRLSRPIPNHDITCAYGDNPWRAANASESLGEDAKVCPDSGDDEGYIWKRPSVVRRRSDSISHSRSHPTSRRSSPSDDSTDSFGLEISPGSARDDEYDVVLGYSGEFLAGMLCPQSSMCHQKFGLVVDDLAFIGHPVCAEPDGTWRFTGARPKVVPRGRGSKKGETPQQTEKSLTPDRSEWAKRPVSSSSWLQTFHFVLVLDRPDPYSSTSGTVWKYFNTIYEHIAFTFTAVLYQEQVLHNFVERECDALGSLKDDYMRRAGEPFNNYTSEALLASSVASAMKAVYEAIKSGSLARITIQDLTLEVQLPLHLDSLLHPEDDVDADIYDQGGGFDLPNEWGDVTKRPPTLAPWKSLLRLDNENEDERGYDLNMRLRSPDLAPEDRELAEQLIKFLDLASVTLSLADMGSLLDWDLESQVYPTVRWLVNHRRAKVVDIVHPGLKTIFSVPQKFPAPLPRLSAEFDRAFSDLAIQPLPKILSMVSIATHRQSANHFYATVVRSKELIPLYQEVVIWMLKRDLLITLHLRIRIVATEELKDRVRMKFEMARAKREYIHGRSMSLERGKESLSVGSADTKGTLTVSSASDSSSGVPWFSLSPRFARKAFGKRSSGGQNPIGNPSSHSDTEKLAGDEYDDDFALEAAEEWEDWYRGEDNNPYSSLISDPARATRLERLWLAAMSDGKDPYIKKRFELINQYFDGKCTDDEILFRAEISRRQLREVLHHYEEHVETFLHPS